MTFRADVTIKEIGEAKTSARGNNYVPVVLEHKGENFKLAAMKETAKQLSSFTVGDSAEATFSVRQFGKEYSLALLSLVPSGAPF